MLREALFSTSGVAEELRSIVMKLDLKMRGGVSSFAVLYVRKHRFTVEQNWLSD